MDWWKENTTLYKVIQPSLPGLYVAIACSLCSQQKLFHTKKNRAKFQNGLTERIHLDLSFLCVWFLMTHYRKFTMKKSNKGDFNFFECFKFPVLEFKMEKDVKRQWNRGRGGGWLFPKCLIFPGNKSKHNVYTQIYCHFQHSVTPHFAFGGHRPTVLTTITSEGAVEDTRNWSRGYSSGSVGRAVHQGSQRYYRGVNF